jgi:hypothetical protein
MAWDGTVATAVVGVRGIAAAFWSSKWAREAEARDSEANRREAREAAIRNERRDIYRDFLATVHEAQRLRLASDRLAAKEKLRDMEGTSAPVGAGLPDGANTRGQLRRSGGQRHAQRGEPETERTCLGRHARSLRRRISGQHGLGHAGGSRHSAYGPSAEQGGEMSLSGYGGLQQGSFWSACRNHERTEPMARSSAPNEPTARKNQPWAVLR